MPAGRPRKPQALLDLQGTSRADRARTPPRPGGKPKMPSWLDAEAKRWWRRVVPQLVRLGIATNLDSDTLAGCARWFSIWRAADARLASGDGDYKQTLAVLISWKQFAAAVSKFGLSPTDRERLRDQLSEPADDSDLIEQLRAIS